MPQRNFLINTTTISTTASGTTIGSGNVSASGFVVARTLVRTGIAANEFASGSQTWSIHYVVSAMTTPYNMRLKVQRRNSSGVMQAESGYGTTRSTTGTYDDNLTADLGTWATNDQLALVWEHERPSGTGNKNGTIDANGASYIDAPTPPLNLPQTLADDVNNLTDARSVGHGHLYTDSVNNLADTVRIVLGLPLTLSDNTNNLTDGAVNVLGVMTTATDFLQSLTDALIQLLSYELALADSEAANWADSHQLLLAHFLALADSYLLTDANVIRMEQRAGYSDTLGTLSDAAELQLGTTLTLTDTLNDLADALDLQLGQYLQLADPVSEFPSTGILDDFNRADEGPPPSSNWITGVGLILTAANVGHRVVSNQLRRQVADDPEAESYWSAEQFGPDCEAYITVTSFGVNQVVLGARLTNIGAGTTNGYAVAVSASDYYQIWRLDDGLLTLLVDEVVLPTIVSGNSYGIRIIGSLIQFWVNTGDGWTVVGEVEDSTYTGAGELALLTRCSAASTFDNFGGGRVMAASTINDALSLGHGLITSDALVLSDGVVLQGDLPLAFTDVLTLADTESHALELRFSFTDDINLLADSEAQRLVHLKPFEDSFTLADELALGYGLILDDDVDLLADVYAQTLHEVTNALELELDDSLTFTDSLALGHGLIFTEDAGNLTDSEVNVLSQLLTFTDAITFTDSTTLIQSQLFAFNDSFILVDSQSSTLGYSQLFTDTLSLTDDEANQLYQLLEFSDTISLTDARALLLAHLLMLNDALSLNDSAALLLVYLLDLSDDANFIADSVQTDAPQGPNRQVGMTDALTVLGDEVSLRLGYFLTLTDTEAITLTDSIAISEGLLTAFSDSFTLSDATATTLGYSQPLADSFTLSDAVQLRLGYELLLSDTVVLSDSIQLQLGYQIALSDNAANWADSAAITLGLSLIITDNGPSFTESISFFSAGRLQLFDSLALTDSLTKSGEGFLPLVDSLTLTDKIDIDLRGPDLELSFTDTLTLADAISLTLADELRYQIVLTDTITLLDHYFDLRHPYTPSAKRHVVVPSRARETRVPASDRETVPVGSRTTKIT